MAFEPGVPDLGVEEDRIRPGRSPRVAIARAASRNETTFETSFRRNENQRPRRTTPISWMMYDIWGSKKIASRIPRAADGVSTGNSLAPPSTPGELHRRTRPRRGPKRGG